MPPIPGLPGGEAGQSTQIKFRIGAYDVGRSVVEGAVSIYPAVRISPNGEQTPADQSVRPGQALDAVRIKKGVVISVVLNVEPNGRRGEGEGCAGCKALDPTRGEHDSHVGSDEPQADDEGLSVELPTRPKEIIIREAILNRLVQGRSEAGDSGPVGRGWRRLNAPKVFERTHSASPYIAVES